MSYLDKLLEGIEVEWKSLGEACSNIISGKNKIRDNSGLYPIFGSTGVIGRTTDKVYEQEQILVARVGANAGYVHIAQGQYDVSDNTLIVQIKELIILKYLYYLLVNMNLNQFAQGAGQPLITAGQLKSLPIPIPPLSVQKEIVRILDTFTGLTNHLTNHLTNELITRKKQYSYYREQLLSFDEGDVEWKALGEVAEYSRERVSFSSIDKSNYVGVDNLLQNRAGKTDSNYVPTEGNLTGYYVGDILIGNIRPYLKKIWLADRIGGTNGDVLVIHINDQSVDSQFLHQVLSNDKFFEYNMQHAKGAKMPRGNKQKIMEYKIPIPPIKEQARIVSILDKFDTLTTSISEYLPKEIELRKKQYEYYRDLLLTFPKDNLTA